MITKENKEKLRNRRTVQRNVSYIVYFSGVVGWAGTVVTKGVTNKRSYWLDHKIKPDTKHL